MGVGKRVLEHGCGTRFVPAWLSASSPFELFRRVYARAVRAMLAVEEWPPDVRDIRTRLLFIANDEDAIVPAGEVPQVR